MGKGSFPGYTPGMDNQDYTLDMAQGTPLLRGGREIPTGTGGNTGGLYYINADLSGTKAKGAKLPPYLTDQHI